MLIEGRAAASVGSSFLFLPALLITLDGKKERKTVETPVMTEDGEPQPA